MILPYIIKSAMALALLYTCIIPLLEKETFHRLNRILILGCLIMSFAIPLVHFTGGTNPTVDMVRQAVQLPEVLINGNANEQSVWSWADIMTCIYIIGVVAIFLMTVVQTASLILRLRKCEHITDNRGNTIVLTDCATSPFCLFHYIVMSRDDYANNRSFILTHEQEHIRLRHYIDLIILQIATIIQWFNPFVWLIGKNLKAIHEFEVDEAVLNKGINATQYQQFLVVKAVGNRLQPFANNLNKEIKTKNHYDEPEEIKQMDDAQGIVHHPSGNAGSECICQQHRREHCEERSRPHCKRPTDSQYADATICNKSL